MIALIAAAVAATAPVNAVETLERMYQQSCSVKAYGSYDDICNGLRKQLKDAQKQQKKDLARERIATREEPAVQPRAATAPALSLTPARD